MRAQRSVCGGGATGQCDKVFGGAYGNVIGLHGGCASKDFDVEVINDQAFERECAVISCQFYTSFANNE